MSSFLHRSFWLIATVTITTASTPYNIRAVQPCVKVSTTGDLFVSQTISGEHSVYVIPHYSAQQERIRTGGLSKSV